MQSEVLQKEINFKLFPLINEHLTFLKEIEQTIELCAEITQQEQNEDIDLLVEEMAQSEAEITREKQALEALKTIAINKSISEIFKEELSKISLTKSATFLNYKKQHCNEEIDEDLEIIGHNETFKCPITVKLILFKQVRMIKPFTSKKCKHSFSDAIFTLIGAQQRVECPSIGCSFYIKKTDLYEDKKLERKILKSQRNEESDQEQEFVVE